LIPVEEEPVPDEPFDRTLEPDSGVGELTGDHVEISSVLVRLTEETASMTVPRVVSLGPAGLREYAPGWLRQHVVDHEDLRDEVATRVAAALDELDDRQLSTILEAYATAGETVRFLPYVPAARHVSREFVRCVPTTTSTFGVDVLTEVVEQGPCLVVCNSLSYADSQFIDLLLSDVEDEDTTDRLVFLAGPRAYDHPYRRLAAVALNTVPVAPCPPRRFAPAAEHSGIAGDAVELARQLLRGGYAVVLYPELLRSRSRSFGSFVEAACAFVPEQELRIVPMALTGSDEAFPVHQHQLGPAPITLSAGEPIDVAPLGARSALGAAWHQIAELLPPEYQPVHGTPPLR
jgi:1-acyl-sn-glycerol-3-phosphate acyltransferase